MKFADVPLFIAVNKVRRRVERAGSDDWIGKHVRHAYKLVMSQLIDDEAWTDAGLCYSPERVAHAWRQLRKVKKLRRTCEVAEVRGPVCFWADRGLGPCSDEIDLDRLIPGSLGGDYSFANCVLSCSAHNRARGNRTVEEYLRTRSDPARGQTSESNPGRASRPGWSDRSDPDPHPRKP